MHCIALHVSVPAGCIGCMTGTSRVRALARGLMSESHNPFFELGFELWMVCGMWGTSSCAALEGFVLVGLCSVLVHRTACAAVHGLVCCNVGHYLLSEVG